MGFANIKDTELEKYTKSRFEILYQKYNDTPLLTLYNRRLVVNIEKEILLNSLEIFTKNKWNSLNDNTKYI